MRIPIAVLIGLLIWPPTDLAARTQQQADTEVSFDFQNADIKVVLTAVAQAGGLNVVFTDLPARSVTLRTNQPVHRGQVRALLESIATANALRIHEEAGLLRIEVIAPAAPQNQIVQQTSEELLLFVHRLKHAPATYLAGVLQALFGGGTTVPASSLNRESLSSQLRNQRVQPAPTGPPNQETQGTPGLPGMQGQIQGKIHIVPDELTNALMIRATASDFEIIKAAIQALDVRPLQVMIEVLVAEVRRTSSFELGVSIETPLHRDPRTGALIGGKLEGRTTGDLIIKVMELGNIKADVILSALAERAHVSILSRPIIFAQNNQEARILVGSQRPFVQVFRSLPTESAVRDQVVQYRDVGTVLSILPTINEDGYVSLQLLQEVSSATNETQFGAPVISTREASTRLLVKDSQTVVIGGLIDRQRDHTRSGIPILKDIPVLGGLFGSTQRGDFQTEMFLFLTPHIVRTDQDAEGLRRGIERNTDHLRKHLPDRSVMRGCGSLRWGGLACR